METKPTQHWYQSRGMIGAAITVVAAGAGVFGIAVSEADIIQLTDYLIVIATAIGGIMSWIGRKNAKGKIG